MMLVLNYSTDYFVYNSAKAYDICIADVLHWAYSDTKFSVILIRSSVYSWRFVIILFIFFVNSLTNFSFLRI